MKFIFKASALLLFVFFTLNTQAQRIKKTEGDYKPLQNESTINIEFTYEKVAVGKFDDEADYIKKKTDEYNKKEPGRGDNWAKAWLRDREERYEPKFVDLFVKESKRTISREAKYTLIFKTKSIEPGYNIGGGFGMYGGRKNAEIDAEVWIVETANRNNIIAKITVENAPGGVWGGYDYDTGSRVAESYAISGKKLAKFIY